MVCANGDADPMTDTTIVPTIAAARLGPLTVSRLAFGCMLLGDRTPAELAPKLLDRFLDAGGRLLDTADVYGDGTSERVLAPWLAKHRDDVIVATKLRFGMTDAPGGAGLAPARIRAACDASLQRLRIDEIDLYQVHAPDLDVPLEDQLEALDGLVRAGKVRALGASNFPGWLLAWAVALQDRHGWAPFVSLQPQYSLVERSIELDALQFCRAAGLGVLPWGPLGAGFLTGRYRRGAVPEPGSRVGDAVGTDLEEAWERRATDATWAAVAACEQVAGELGETIPRVAIAWLLHQPAVTAPIIGPRTVEQLDDLLGAAELRLDDDQLARLSAAAPPQRTYPQRKLLEQLDVDLATLRLARTRPPSR
jgi:aryl-alcohol dehydrogenase-like predicted oxidoreductase